MPFEVLDKLIAAGLGDIPRFKIERAQFERAMRGQVVKVLPNHSFSCYRLQNRPLCPNCGKDEARVQATFNGKRRGSCRGCRCVFVVAYDYQSFMMKASAK
jgi:hypothetical protein